MPQILLRTAALVLLSGATLFAQSRVGDVTTIDGVQENTLFGLGLVIGLDGTGDGDGHARQLAANYMQRMNLKVQPSDISGNNIAARTSSSSCSSVQPPGPCR